MELSSAARSSLHQPSRPKRFRASLTNCGRRLTPEGDRDLTVITLKAMQFNALVGILPSEITNPQPIEVDLVLQVERAEKIDLKHILDYRLAYDAVAGVVTAGHVDLLEKMAESIGTEPATS